MIRSFVLRFLAVSTLLLFSQGVQAQEGRGVPSDLQRFSPKQLTFKNSAGSSQYRLATKYVLIQFQEHIAEEVQRAMLAEDPAFAPLTENTILPAPRVAMPELREGISEQEVVDLLNRLASMPEVRYANPFLQYSDGTLMGIQDRFHVKLRSVSDRSILETMAREQGAVVLENYSFDPLVYVLSADKNAAGNAFELARRFEESRRFDYAEPDFLVLMKRMNTNDTYLAYQWSLNNTGSAIQYNGTPGADMEVFNAWGLSTGSSSVKVAIIDEGTDLTHPDLVGNMLAGFDATGLGSGGGPQNNDAHGTACAGIVAAVGNNNLGIAGIAYNSKIVPIRIAYDNGSGNWVTSWSWIANALNWAWNQGGADVLSNSWGGGGPSSLVNTAINNAITLGRGGLGSSVLFSAGNGNGAVNYPANNNQTIAVAAMSMCEERKSPTSCDGETWWGSDYGTNLDVSAPGVKIYTTDISGAAGYNGTDYTATFNGTSSACPNAAGVMALIYSMNPLLSHTQARQILESTTEKVGGYTYTANVSGQPNGTWSNDLGYGRVNAYNAVLAAQTSICVTDTTRPTITAPANVTLPNAIGQCSRPAAQVTLGTPATGDNCPATLVVSNDAPATFPNGVTTVIWTVVDGNGNMASAAQTVTITDVVPPTIAAPANVTVSTPAGMCAVPSASVMLGTPVTNDDCPTTVTVSNNAPASFPLGTTTVVWTATDGSGNFATATQTVTVNDVIAPTITAPANVTLPTTVGLCSRSAALVALGTPTVADNCPNNITYSNNAPAVYPTGVTNVVWTVTDGSGNQAMATQMVTIVDIETPKITAPANITLPNAPGMCSLPATSVNLGTPKTADNCPSSLIVTNNAPAVFPNGVTNVVWTVVDGGNNMATATQVVTIIDIVPPTIAAPANLTLPTTPGMCSVDASIVNLGTPVVTDDCPASLVITNNAPPVFPLGTTTVVWTVKDGGKNVATASQTVTIVDNEKPVIIAPANHVLPTAPGQCSVSASSFVLGKALVTDNCPLNLSFYNDAPAVYPLGVTTVTWTAVDGSNNMSTATQTVTVLDLEPPTITACAADMSVEGSAQNDAVLPDMRGQIQAYDNCTTTASLVITQSPAPNTVVGLGGHTVTFTVDDGNGNNSTCASKFTVVPRVEIDPAASFIVASGACKKPVVVSRSVTIDNSGGNFGGGKLQWTASTAASEITLVTSSGLEGDDLVFVIDPRRLPTGTLTRTITIDAKNSVTNVPAINTPFTMTVSIQIEPAGTVSLTKSVGTSWTVFTNSSGQKIAEVKSNAGSIGSFTVNMHPCSYPQGLGRVRYVHRYYTMSSNATNPNVDIRLFYTNTEAEGLITQPSALSVWQRPTYAWMNLGGTSNVFENFVELSGLTNLTGPFAMAHKWFPKSGDEAVEAVPASITLSQNYPNPFNPTTVIRYSLAEAAPVRLVVHDFFGREVAVLAEGTQNAGSHEVVFDAAGLPSGSYMCTLESDGVQLRRSMILTK